MGKRFSVFLGLSVVVFALIASAAARAAEEYAVDAAHAGVTFKISHMGLSWTYGRFNTVTGSFSIDPADPGKCAFSLDIKADSLDTGNKQRDGHLHSPDFLNVKQYPAVSFKSTSVKPSKDGYEVTGDFTLHGTTRPITFTLVGGRKAEFPKGVYRTGFSTDLVLKRSAFGMDKMIQAIGDDVAVSISFEGTKK